MFCGIKLISKLIVIKLLQFGHSKIAQNSFTAAQVCLSLSIDNDCAQAVKCVLGLIVQRSTCNLL